jgi:hypothetical protein
VCSLSAMRSVRWLGKEVSLTEGREGRGIEDMVCRRRGLCDGWIAKDRWGREEKKRCVGRLL